MEISIAAEKLFSLWGFPVTNALLVGIGASLFLISVSFLISKNLSLVPRGLQNVFEIVFEALLDLVDSVTQDKEQTRRFFPLIATIFLFVLCVNWVELLPGLGTIGLREAGHATIVPFLRSTSADLNFTLALSLIAVVTIQVTGIATLGAAKYGRKYLVAPWKKPYVIGMFVGLLELVSEIGRIISFTFRLFGNIFAGEVLLTVMLHLVPYVLPLPFLFLEIFVGFIQAVVFAMLTLAFLKMATLDLEH